jgi:phosphopantothenoylcysteine decarboxylase/phosphopantothenate--cysteine ligase
VSKPLTILVTAGPTREAIDPVRFISNRSSGRMGYAIAAAAARRGHTVKLVSGPVALDSPGGVQLQRVVSAADMLAAVEAAIDASDVLVMAAAVADWRPKRTAASKLKKADMDGVLELERTVDILAHIRERKGERLVIGFAAETGDPLPEARRKLEAKGLDAILANDVSQPDAGFEAETNRVTLLTRDGTREDWGLLPKAEIGDRLIRWIETRRG